MDNNTIINETNIISIIQSIILKLPSLYNFTIEYPIIKDFNNVFSNYIKEINILKRIIFLLIKILKKENFIIPDFEFIIAHDLITTNNHLFKDDVEFFDEINNSNILDIKNELDSDSINVLNNELLKIKAIEDLNIQSLSPFLLFVDENIITPFLHNLKKVDTNKTIIKIFLIFTKKLEIIISYFIKCNNVPKDDLTCKPYSSNIWIEIFKNHVELINCDSEEILKTEFQNLNKYILRVIAAWGKTTDTLIKADNTNIKIENNSNNSLDNYKDKYFAPKLNKSFWKNLIKTAITNDEAKYKYDAELFLNFPNPKALQFLWNMPESKIMKIQRNITLTKINYIIKFSITPDTFYYLFPNYLKHKSDMSDEVNIPGEPPKQLKEVNLKPNDLLEINTEHIMIRFISNEKLDFEKYFKIKLNFKKNLKNKYYRNIVYDIDNSFTFEDFKKYFKKVIIHYHGGAFIAMSSSVHQC